MYGRQYITWIYSSVHWIITKPWNWFYLARGEPLMAGMDFFQRVIQYQKRYGKGKQIYNSIQTNGVLLTAEWAKFLKEHHFLVGISLDEYNGYMIFIENPIQVIRFLIKLSMQFAYSKSIKLILIFWRWLIMRRQNIQKKSTVLLPKNFKLITCSLFLLSNMKWTIVNFNIWATHKKRERKR